MPLADYFIKVGDTGLDLLGIVRDEDGNPKDIAGATVRFHMKTIGGVAKTNAVAVNDTVSRGAGAVKYSWAPTDVDTAGFYVGEWQVTYVGGDVQTFPNDRSGFLIKMEAALA